MATPVRSSPQAQQLQTNSPYTDIHTTAISNPLCSHSHPEPKRWHNPGGWGARHINDTAPFTLWNEQERKFRLPTREELLWIWGKFGLGDLAHRGWYMRIETARPPPQPVPLTVGCMPMYFVGTGESHFEARPRGPHPNPRAPDPCPALRLPAMQFPTREQNIAVLTALERLADVRAIVYLPRLTVVELRHGDGRTYGPRTLPGVVAGRTTVYHHAEEPFYKSMKDYTRVRVVDPQERMNNNQVLPQTLPQDDANCLRNLLKGDQIKQGSWSEVDGMSSRPVSLLAYGILYEEPKRPCGSPPVDFRQWQPYTVYSVFGAINSTVAGGVGGAPIVDCNTGGVGGFFHLFDGANCLSAPLDDLVTEGWEVV